MGKVNYVRPFLIFLASSQLVPTWNLCSQGQSPSLHSHTHPLSSTHMKFSLQTLLVSKKWLPLNVSSLTSQILSVLCFLPSAHQRPGEKRVGPGEKRKVAQFPVLPVWISPLPASSPGGEDNGLSISNILWFNDSNFPWPVLFPPHWEKVHGARILTHFSLHKACLLNI